MTVTGLQADARAIQRHIGKRPPFNLMLFCQVAEILISLSAFSDRGRRVVEGVMNQIALFWLLTIEAEQDQQFDDDDDRNGGGGGGEGSDGGGGGGTKSKAPVSKRQLPVTSKDKMWGLLNFFVNLSRHPQVRFGGAVARRSQLAHHLHVREH